MAILIKAKLPDPVLDDWVWTTILEIPVNEFLSYSLSNKPFKWMRYATGVVLGAEGHLRRGENENSDLVDYDVDENGLGNEQTEQELFYHVPEGRRDIMLPFDLQFPRDRVTSSVGTSRGGDFATGVATRDGLRCVVTNSDPNHCDCAHLVAHSKGDSVCFLSSNTSFPPFNREKVHICTYARAAS